MARIGCEADFGARPDVEWTCRLRGGPHDGDCVTGMGYWDSPPTGTWITEVETVDALFEHCAACDGQGETWVMQADPDCTEVRRTCASCGGRGQAPVVVEALREPVQVRYEWSGKRVDVDYDNCVVTFEHRAGV